MQESIEIFDCFVLFLFSLFSLNKTTKSLLEQPSPQGRRAAEPPVRPVLLYQPSPPEANLFLHKEIGRFSAGRQGNLKCFRVKYVNPAEVVCSKPKFFFLSLFQNIPSH